MILEVPLFHSECGSQAAARGIMLLLDLVQVPASCRPLCTLSPASSPLPPFLIPRPRCPNLLWAVTLSLWFLVPWMLGPGLCFPSSQPHYCLQLPLPPWLSRLGLCSSCFLPPF